MSAEAPRNSGIGEPTSSQKPKGRFSGFLRRLLVSSESQPTQQPTFRITQPPSGLEDFANKIQHGVNNILEVQGQQALDIRNTEVARMTAEAEEKTRIKERQRELEEQELQRKRLQRESASAETSKVLHDFQITERLDYIRKAVWEGRGEIRPIPPQFGSNNKFDILGGLELVFEYPDSYQQYATTREWRNDDNYGWETCDPYPVGPPRVGRSSTRLAIQVLSLDENADGRKKMLWVISDKYNRDLRKAFPVDAEDSKVTLEAVLVEDSVYRVGNGLIPSLLGKKGAKAIAELKKAG